MFINTGLKQLWQCMESQQAGKIIKKQEEDHKVREIEECVILKSSCCVWDQIDPFIHFLFFVSSVKVLCETQSRVF